MNNLTHTVSSIAMLALAVLPIAALSTTAYAAPASVKIADLNLATVEGVATFQQRADFAARRFCKAELSLSARANCHKGVQAELNDKMAAARTTQAARQSTTLAAR